MNVSVQLWGDDSDKWLTVSHQLRNYSHEVGESLQKQRNRNGVVGHFKAKVTADSLSNVMLDLVTMLSELPLEAYTIRVECSANSVGE